MDRKVDVQGQFGTPCLKRTPCFTRTIHYRSDFFENACQKEIYKLKTILTDPNS